MNLTNFGMVMERSTYFLVTLLSLAMGVLHADESVHEDDLTASHEEIAVLKRQPKGLDAVSGDAHRLTALEQQMNDVYTSTARDTFGAKTAIARPQLDNYRLYVATDALFWKAFEGGKDYASITNSTTVPMKGRSKFVDFDWQWGFRTKLGYRTSHDGWDLVARYTWFFDKGESEPDLSDGKFATELFYTPGSTNGSSINSSARLHLQEGDLSLQKSYFLSRHFSLTWSAALRSSWINQHTKSYSFASGSPPAQMLEQIGESDFWGIGPMLTVGPRWFVNRNWNFFGSFAGSLLYGEFDVRVRTEPNGLVPGNFKIDQHLVVPTVLGSLGMGWESNFLCDRFHVAINVAYEAQYWWRQNQFLSYRLASDSTLVLRRLAEDLGLHGLTINALFDF